MNTVKKLLALLDGSIYSQSVCDHSAWVASQIGASVDILHVLERRGRFDEPANLSGSIGLGARTALLEELAELDAQKGRLSQKLGRAILDDASKRVKAAGVESVTTKLRFGEIVETLEEFEVDADLVIVGKRGEVTNADEIHIGSNLERVVRSSHKPVLVASRSFKPVKRFMVAFDGGPSAMKAIEHIAQSNLLSDIKCNLLMVGQPGDESLNRLDQAADKLRAHGIEVTAESQPGQADNVIAQKVEAEAIDLLVMGAYGHSRIRNMIIGSTTTQMIRSCKIPVLLFR